MGVSKADFMNDRLREQKFFIIPSEDSPSNTVESSLPISPTFNWEQDRQSVTGKETDDDKHSSAKWYWHDWLTLARVQNRGVGIDAEVDDGRWAMPDGRCLMDDGNYEASVRSISIFHTEDAMQLIKVDEKIQDAWLHSYRRKVVSCCCDCQSIPGFLENWIFAHTQLEVVVFRRLGDCTAPSFSSYG